MLMLFGVALFVLVLVIGGPVLCVCLYWAFKGCLVLLRAPEQPDASRKHGRHPERPLRHAH